jgi:gliding motility-associated-like protein
METNDLCTDTSTVIFDFTELPVANAGEGGTECDLDFVLSANSSVGSGVWSLASGPGSAVFGDTTSPFTTVTVSDLGSYVFQWTETNGLCTDMDEIFVLFNPSVAVDAGPDTSLSLGNSVVLTASGGTTYNWAPDIFINTSVGASIVASPIETTTYIVTSLDAAGCPSVDSLTVTVLEDYSFTISNLMTPNGDGFNDFWYIDNIEFYPDCEVAIYNRYGNLLYSKKGYQNDWDGQYNGQNLPDGTYYYIINCSGNQDVHKGGITIFRRTK